MVLFFILVLIALVILMSIRLGKDNFNVTEFFLHCFAIMYLGAIAEEILLSTFKITE